MINTQSYAEYQLLTGSEISVELSEYIINLCKEKSPQTILDMGSGWSSFLFRTICQNSFVLSIDDNKDWLTKTVEFCKQHNVEPKNMVLWNDLNVHEYKNTFDIALHDFGNRQARSEVLPFVINMMKSGGILIIDDMHKKDLRVRVEEILQQNNLNWTDLKYCTLDKASRYAYRVDIPIF